MDGTLPNLLRSSTTVVLGLASVISAMTVCITIYHCNAKGKIWFTVAKVGLPQMIQPDAKGDKDASSKPSKTLDYNGPWCSLHPSHLPRIYGFREVEDQNADYILLIKLHFSGAAFYERHCHIVDQQIALLCLLYLSVDIHWMEIQNANISCVGWSTNCRVWWQCQPGQWPKWQHLLNAKQSHIVCLVCAVCHTTLG